MTISVPLTPYSSPIHMFFWILSKILIVKFMVEVNFFLCAMEKQTVDEQRNLTRANEVFE